MELHCCIIIRPQIVLVSFALYICAMVSREKMSSGNTDTAFANNYGHDYNYMASIQSIV